MHRGASWASGAAQAAQFVRIILVWLCGFHELRAATWRFFAKQRQNGFEPSITLAAMLRQGGNLESLRKDRRLVLDGVRPVAQRPRPAHVDAVRLQRREQRIGPDAALARRLRRNTRGALPDGVDEVLQSFTSSQRADRPLRAVAVMLEPP